MELELEELRQIASDGDDVRAEAEFRIRQFQKAARIVVVVNNSKARLGASAYEAIDRTEAIDGIQRGLESMERGEGNRLQMSLPASESDTAFLRCNQVSHYHRATGGR